MLIHSYPLVTDTERVTRARHVFSESLCAQPTLVSLELSGERVTDAASGAPVALRDDGDGATVGAHLHRCLDR